MTLFSKLILFNNFVFLTEICLRRRDFKTFTKMADDCSECPEINRTIRTSLRRVLWSPDLFKFLQHFNAFIK